MNTATTPNADAVHEHMDAASRHLIDAVAELRCALGFASLDFPGNDEVVRQLLGATQLLSGNASLETSMWWQYSRERARQSGAKS